MKLLVRCAFRPCTYFHLATGPTQRITFTPTAFRHLIHLGKKMTCKHFETKCLRKISGVKRKSRIDVLTTINLRDSSVGIPLGYGLEDRSTRVRFPVGAGNFSLHHRVQNGPGTHPASYPMGTRGSFPGGKAAEA
jgi:hypothetical protein